MQSTIVAPWNKQAFLPLLLPMYMYLGKHGSHACKGPFRTLQPCSQSHGVKNVTMSKFSWCQIFVGSLNHEN